MSQFEGDSDIKEEVEIKVGDVKVDFMIRQVNSHQLMQIMRIVDAHDLEYGYGSCQPLSLDNDFNMRDMIFDLINKNDYLPSFMKKLVENMDDEYCDWEDDSIQSTLEKASEMEYYFVK